MSRFTVALSGLTETDAAFFTATLERMSGGEWKLVETTPASLLVVDIDSVWGHMDWLRATATGQEVVAYTKDERVRGCDLVLNKPLHAGKIVALLDGIKGNLVVQPTKSAPAPATTTPATPAPKATAPVPAPAVATTPHAVPVRVVPEMPAEPPAPPAPAPPPAMTLGECLLTGGITTPLTVTGTDGVQLTLDPERGGYTGTPTLKPLGPLLATPMAQMKPLAATAIERLRQSPALPLTRLMWFAALSASPGRLAPELDPLARYHLARWPQIEREFPRHFRIATTMMKGPATLEEIAAAASAPMSDVTDFINAYTVAGYVTNDAVDATEPEDTASAGGMFSRLRRPFSRGGQEST